MNSLTSSSYIRLNTQEAFRATGRGGKTSSKKVWRRGCSHSD